MPVAGVTAGLILLGAGSRGEGGEAVGNDLARSGWSVAPRAVWLRGSETYAHDGRSEPRSAIATEEVSPAARGGQGNRGISGLRDNRAGLAT